MKEIEGLECIHIQGSNHYNPPISPLLSSLTFLSLSTLLPFFRLLSFWHIDFVNIQVYLITWLRQKGGKQQPSVSSLSSPLASFSTISADVSLRCESWLQNHHNQFFLFSCIITKRLKWRMKEKERTFVVLGLERNFLWFIEN